MNRVSTLLAGLSAAALLAAPHAWAQEAGQDTGTRIPDAIELPGATPAPTPAPSGGIVAIPANRGGSNGAIGPGSLSDFSLGGPTQRPTPAPTPSPSPAPAPQRSLPTPPPPPTAAGSGGRAIAAPPETLRNDGLVGNVTPVAPPESPREIQAPPMGGFDLDAPGGLTTPESGMGNWPWLLAFFGLLGAGLFAWQMRRQRVAVAGGPALERAATPEPAAPRPLPPQPVAPPKPAVPSGLVTSSALKPELRIDVEPVRAVYSDDGFSLDYRLTITNVGHGAAQRPTLRQDWLFASATQASDYEAFLARPVDASDRPLPESIPPQTGLRLDGRAVLPLDQVRAVIIDGRQLLLPILALGVRHGGQSPAQKPAADGMWLIGRKGGADGRMAPIRADRGPRIIRDVELKRQ